MLVQKFFHLDCNSVIPECGHRCARCIEEIRSVLERRDGVSEVSLGARGEISGIVVKYDSERTSDEHLIDELSNLPSFYRGRFVPKVLDA
jgi:copper chaperone CopZ